ncbi:hypothetical protein ACIBJF_47285 [Streptomyces sp. NPDC050743]|uniref:hypothetical protein n=1 Tax=Streptomyces sp. NPDC050743 TaxID=3365634 RepID=UPI00379BCD9A
MTRLAIRRRFLTRGATVAAAALLVTACSADPDRSDNTSSAPITPAHLSYTLPNDPVRMVLPATGAETRWTQGLDVFGQQVARATAASCARKVGIGLPEQIPVAFIRFFELPDLDFIARHGLSESAAVPTSAAGPESTRSGSKAAIGRCQDEGTAALSALRDSYGPLQRAWFTELADLRRGPATVRALGALPDCLSRHGFQVRDEQDFMRLGDARGQTASAADLPYIEAEMGRAYATCMRPVEAVREPARLRLRARFCADHADDIRDLRRTLVPMLRLAEKQHGVRLAFPAP